MNDYESRYLPPPPLFPSPVPLRSLCDVWDNIIGYLAKQKRKKSRFICIGINSSENKMRPESINKFVSTKPRKKSAKQKEAKRWEREEMSYRMGISASHVICCCFVLYFRFCLRPFFAAFFPSNAVCVIGANKTSMFSFVFGIYVLSPSLFKSKRILFEWKMELLVFFFLSLEMFGNVSSEWTNSGKNNEYRKKDSLDFYKFQLHLV